MEGAFDSGAFFPFGVEPTRHLIYLTGTDRAVTLAAVHSSRGE